MTINRLQSATESLSQLDISGLVTSMALGIAEAQKQLDENSISQAIILADANLGINGQSLLELGFVPTFYAFQYVDLSANMSLKVSSDFSLDVGLELGIGVGGDRSKASSEDLLASGEDSASRREFTSSTSVVVEVSSTESMLVGAEEKVVKMDLQKGCVRRRHKLKEDLRQVSEVDRVESSVEAGSATVQNSSASGVFVNYVGGFLCIAFDPMKAIDYGIIELQDQDTATSITVGNDGTAYSFTVDPDFSENVARATTQIHTGTGAGNGYGFKGDKMYFINPASVTTPWSYDATDVIAEELGVYFDVDHDEIVDTYENANKSNETRLQYMAGLASLMKNVPSLTLEVIGHTDSLASPEYNKGLGQRRADALAAWLIKHDVPAERIIAKSQGEKVANDANEEDFNNNDRRRAVVNLLSENGYIVVEEGKLDAADPNATGTAAPYETAPNSFVYLHQEDTSDNDVDATINDGSGTGDIAFADLAVTTANISSSTITSALATNKYVGLDVHNDIIHFVNEKLRYSYTALSKSESEVVMKKSASSSSSNTASTTNTESLVIGESQSQSSYALKDSESSKSKKSWSLDASLDARVASRFSFSIDGNSSMSARMVALPAPQAFLDLVAANVNTP